MPPKAKVNAKSNKSTQRGMDGKYVSKMLGIMNYTASNAKRPEDAEEARCALDVYKFAHRSFKAMFLNNFHKCGRGKHGYSWIHELTVSAEDEVAVSTVEDWIFRCSLLEKHGLPWHTFETDDDAVVCSDRIHADNKETHGHPGTVILDANGDRKLDKLWFVDGHGVKRSRKMKEVQKFTGTCGNIKNALKDFEVPLVSDSAGPIKGIKSEVPSEKLFKDQLSQLRTMKNALEKKLVDGWELATRTRIKARIDSTFVAKASQIEASMQALNTFVGAVRTMICEAAVVDMSDESVVSAELAKLEALFRQGDHHVGGFKEMSKRFAAMLA
eukprot:TRINITY_DN5132_c0_g1_i7.p1 TRINITY_DN5132_c0_g1~~TRINITY_DN5132_c0_g1_i7.p1  ORF type:complete len:328 (+),score=77.13 TRINITY_DN5132_c0_g1_i7:135-1118(+)